ncbi:MAG: ABC transporter ATP-binding protein [Candidatus Aminicenantes bacterium]|nr:ABC transporter ATP-binding protein [Candidatus Aminicenantes bacterium]
MNNDNTIIEVKGLSLAFEQKKVLDNINVTFKKGETVLIAGNNGTGKSSLLRIMAGVLFPDSGDVHIDESISRRKIAFISDKMSLFQDYTLDQGIAFHCRVFGLESCDDSLLDELNIDRNQKIRDLSKGERAIYHLSLLLSQKPEILLLDEIVHAIDPYLRDLFLDALIDLIDELNTTVIMVNHTFSEVGRLPERVMVMENGRFIFDENCDVLHEKIKKVRLDSPGDKEKKLLEELPVIFQTRSPLLQDYFIYPFKEEFTTQTNYKFQDVELSEIIKSFIGGYYAKKRI